MSWAASDHQANRARNPPPRPATRGPYDVRKSAFNVAPEPVASAGFTFERAAAFQCVAGVQYAVDPSGNVAHFVVENAKEFVLAVTNTDHLPKTPILQKLAEILDKHDTTTDLLKVMSVRSIQYGQLVKKRQDDIDWRQRDPPANEVDYLPELEFETFKVTETKNGKTLTKTYVQAPASEGGWFAEVTGDTGLKYKLVFNLTLDLEDFKQDARGVPGDFTYCARFEYSMRGRDNLYISGHSTHEQVVKLSLGHWHPTTERFVSWGAGNFANWCLPAKEHGITFFDQRKWPKTSAFPDDLSEAMEVESTTTARGRFIFADVDDKLCEMRPGKRNDDEPQPIVLASFTIPKVLAEYQFVEYGEKPLWKLLCRVRLAPVPRDGEDITAYITAEQGERGADLDGATVLEVEVVMCISTLSSPKDVSDIFSSMHSKLQTSSMTPEHLKCYVVEIGTPLPKNVIVRWGLQDSGWWVMHNCAFKNGMTESIESAGHAIVTSYFNNNERCPMATKDFPRIIIIPFAHVRYVIGVHMWSYLMPAFFQNNEMPAKAVFALSVLGLHATRCWNGETGLGHGMPVGWVYSTEYCTGKTEAAMLAHTTMGFFHRAIWAGDATKSVTFESSYIESGLMKFIDDIVPPEAKNDGYHSSALAQQIRAFFDRTSRAVTGKIRLPYSGCCYTANCTVNDRDKAFQSRLITIPFKELKMLDDDDLTSELHGRTSDNVYEEYQQTRELMSALLPDLQLIGLFEGKLDAAAMQDWSAFLHKALDKKRNRNLNEWAKVAYIMSLLNVTFQGGREEQEKLMEWMVVTVTKQTYELTNHANVVDQFVIHVLKVHETIAPDILRAPPEKLLFWHNMRKHCHPPGPHYRVHNFWAFRLDRCCYVIQKVTGQYFKWEVVAAALKEHDDAVTKSKCMFYDTTKGPWPIKKSIMIEGEEATGFVDVPLQEYELLPTTLSEQGCVFIKESFIKKIRDSVQVGGAIDVDYKSIVIKSSYRNCPTEYNFFDAITKGGWFGYRSLVNTTFSKFNGMQNEMNIGSMTTSLELMPSVEVMTLEQGYESVNELFRSHKLLEFFNYMPKTIDELGAFPACYLRIPFTFRDAPGDTAADKPFCISETSSVLSSPNKSDSMLNSPNKSDVSRTALSPRGNTNTMLDTEGPPPKRRRRLRASPSNLTRYPRPPDLPLRSMDDALKWMAYVRARGAVVEEEPDEPDDEHAIDNVKRDYLFRKGGLKITNSYLAANCTDLIPRTAPKPKKRKTRTILRATVTSTSRASA